MTLNPDELVVTSFDTESAPDGDADVMTPPNDPTPATYCRWCPEATFTCP
jgi:hypothetical protein